MKVLRPALGVLVGGGVVGIVFGLLAQWFDPCVGPSRFEPCSDDDFETQIPCHMDICDVWRPAWFNAMQFALEIALVVAAGFVAAWLAARWQRTVGAFAALFAMLADGLVRAYVFPHQHSGPHEVVVDDVYSVLFFALVAAIGLCGGMLARRVKAT